MHTYDYELIKNHIIVHQDDETWLIDTGAPKTLSNYPTIKFAGVEYPTLTDFNLVNPGQLTPHVGVEITGLVGMDLLGKFPIEFNPVSSTMTIDAVPFPEGGFSLPMDDYLTIPIINVSFEGKSIRVVFDTGAQISYLDGSMTRDYDDLDLFSDFFPTLGEFQTQTRRVPFSINGSQVELLVGENPNFLQQLFLVSDTVGILGTELLKIFWVALLPTEDGRRKTGMAALQLTGDGG